MVFHKPKFNFLAYRSIKQSLRVLGFGLVIVPALGSAARAGQLSVVDAVPDAPQVDIYVDGQIVANHLSFRETTPPITVGAGSHTILVNVAGASTTVFSTYVTVGASSDQTVALDNRLSKINATIVPTEAQPTDLTMAALSFFHLSPDAPAIDFGIVGGPTLATAIQYTSQSAYSLLSPGTYDLQELVSGTSTVIETEQVSLEAGHAYMLDFLGLVSGTGIQRLQTVLVDSTPFVPVPEPSSIALLSVAVAGVVGARVWPRRNKPVA